MASTISILMALDYSQLNGHAQVMEEDGLYYSEDIDGSCELLPKLEHTHVMYWFW